MDISTAAEAEFVEEITEQESEGQKLQVGTLVWLDPFSINFTPYNPESRSNPDSKDLRTLALSMAQIGLLCPCLVDENADLIDGNRRVLAGRWLANTSGLHVLLPCYVVNTSEYSAARLFAEVNSERVPIRGKDVIDIYLKNSEALPPKLLVKARDAEKRVGGHDRLRELYKVEKGFSLETYAVTKRLLEYLNDEGISFYTAAKWTLYHRLTYKVRKAVRYEMDKDLLKGRIKRNRPITDAEVQKAAWAQQR